MINKQKIFFLCLFLFLVLNPITTRAVSDNQKDAISLRVVPNTDKLSPLGWYYANIGRQGAPQSLLVDGYEAVRDGRTVYVAAANIVDNTIYTNIYIMSYTQEAESDTQDIFGQLIKYWKFNVKLVEDTGNGFCKPNDSAASCLVDSDCQKTNKSASCFDGHCVQRCILSSDCQTGQYCSSVKAKLIRDIKRISDLQSIAKAINNYSSQTNTAPSLISGTYLPGKTISVWPSWNETLAVKLGYKLPVDPVNRLGYCDSNYSPATCWDEKQKKFATNMQSPILPQGSFAYVYIYNESNSGYKLCTNFETTFHDLPETLRCDAAALNVESRAYPLLDLGNSYADEGEFETYFEVNSQQPINWNLTEIKPVDPSSWSAWTSAGWQWRYGKIGLKLENARTSNQKKLTAENVLLPAGVQSKTFKYSVKVYDLNGHYGFKQGSIFVCKPKTCVQAGADCGKIADGCGRTILCGDCNGGTCVKNKCQVNCGPQNEWCQNVNDNNSTQ